MHMTDNRPHAGPSAAERTHALKEDLDALLAKAEQGDAITFREMLETLGERTYAVVILLVSAPFIVIPIPGVSTLFGVVLVALGVCVTFGFRAWLPDFICRRQISKRVLGRLVHGADRVLDRAERLFHPRWEPMFHRLPRVVTGLALVALSVAFALPIPIPWNNGPPAIGLVALALGLLERDGLMVLIGIIYSVVLWVVLFLLGGLVLKAILASWEKLQHLFG